MNARAVDISRRTPPFMYISKSHMRYRLLTPLKELAGLWLEFEIKNLVTSQPSQGFCLDIVLLGEDIECSSYSRERMLKFCTISTVTGYLDEDQLMELYLYQVVGNLSLNFPHMANSLENIAPNFSPLPSDDFSSSGFGSARVPQRQSVKKVN
ncbi:hypothetical protein M431DRAFT_536419 [Trichoderma harzianum CBS 226.95]|uniref:Uncharacterized protein n=1 Tax=Trichoderma harzianum CBS 226.95 TaxID=983964 RepID=A0A2T4ASA5_TRIHA|nr:hypothetical protein M431DRAFT_536419 [Trichoderma harzianum CBS 226.95]PTB59930.1 hypothetical protein M431DRAFT_536419 [Trichoderma harzianum CBS 226.95]